MKHPFRLLPSFLIAAGVLSSPRVSAQSTDGREQEQRVGAAFVLTLGRPPTVAEQAAWLKREPATVADVVNGLRTRLRDDATLQRATRAKAFADAFGRAPEDVQVNSGPRKADGDSYLELVQGHVHDLGQHPTDYERVIQRAYQFVIRRDAYPEEIAYWKERDPLPYALLVACVDDWARRNQPGLMVTTGTPTLSVNCEFLATVRISPAVAAEARGAFGLVRDADAAMRDAGRGHNLVAAGADVVMTEGHMYFVAAGSPELVPSPGDRR